MLTALTAGLRFRFAITLAPFERCASWRPRLCSPEVTAYLAAVLRGDPGGKIAENPANALNQVQVRHFCNKYVKSPSFLPSGAQSHFRRFGVVTIIRHDA